MRYSKVLAALNLTDEISLPLTEMSSAVDPDDFAGRKAGLEQEEDRRGDLDLATPSAKRGCRLDCLQLIVGRFRRREDGAGRNRVHEDVILGELQRKRFGQADDAAFGHEI